MKTLTAAAALIAASLLTAAPGFAQAPGLKLDVTQIVEHPALDSVRKGLSDQLALEGLREGKEIKTEFQSAQGNPATAAQIARKFVGDRPNLIVAISTPSAQTVVAANDTVPVLFSAVTDPVAAKLVTSMEKPGGLVSGVSDRPPSTAQVAMLRQIMPNLKKVGVIYNAGETNSISQLADFKAATAKLGITVVEATAARSSDVTQAAQSLVGKVEAIFLPADNTVISALEAVVRVGRQARLPVFASDTDSVKRGAIAAVGFDYYAVGRETGRMAAMILKGAKPGDLPVSVPTETQLSINEPAAKAAGLTLSADIKKKATLVQ